MFLRQKSIGPMRENETFCSFAQLKKDLGEITTPSELLIVIANCRVGIDSFQKYITA